MLVKNRQQIGAIAQQSGVPIKTIRYYEELGLLKASSRTEGGFRLFDQDVISRLRFIKRAQSLGLSLSEIKEFLKIHDQGKLPCDRIKVSLQEKVQDIEDKIQELIQFKQELEYILSTWKVENSPSKPKICPIIEKDGNVFDSQRGEKVANPLRF